MRKLKQQQVKTLLDNIQIRLNALTRNHADEWHGPIWKHVCERALDDIDEGFGSKGDGTGSRSGHGDPVGSKALHRRDDIARAAAEFFAGLLEAQRGMTRADKAAFALVALTEKEARTLQEKDEIANKPEAQTIAPQCANPNCDRLGGVTDETRLRGGRCNPCRMYLVRNQTERPRVLCAMDTDLTGTEALGLDMERVITGAA